MNIFLCKVLFSTILLFQFTYFHCHGQKYLKTTTGLVSFTSDAPLETIKAQSNKLGAVINPTNGTFAFSIEIKSFNGFNSELQRQHFNEHYLESGKYRYAIFKGKIIESVNFNKNGTYNVRAKGELIIHGVKQERILNSTIVVNNGNVNVYSKFDVPLTDHKIKIPKIVFQKIAQRIDININCRF